MKKIPFETTNDGLAFALQNSGFKPVFLANIYTAKKLESLGYSAGKWDALKAVKDAREKGKPGTVRFFFEDTPELRSAIAAWDEQGADYTAHKTTELPEGVPARAAELANEIHERFYGDAPLPSGLVDILSAALREHPNGRDMMKMGRQLTQTKGAFRDAVMGLPGFFENRDGEAQMVADAGGGFTLICPGFILASEDLSREKAAKLGLV